MVSPSLIWFEVYSQTSDLPLFIKAHIITRWRAHRIWSRRARPSWASSEWLCLLCWPGLRMFTSSYQHVLLLSCTLTWTRRAPALLWVLVYPAPARPVLDPQAWTLEPHDPHQILRKLSLDKTNNRVCWFKLSGRKPPVTWSCWDSAIVWN